MDTLVEVGGCKVLHYRKGTKTIRLRCTCNRAFTKNLDRALNAKELVCWACERSRKVTNPRGAPRLAETRSPNVLKGIELLKQGKPVGDVQRICLVSRTTVEHWYLRWIVYPEWKELKRDKELSSVRNDGNASADGSV